MKTSQWSTVLGFSYPTNLSQHKEDFMKAGQNKKHPKIEEMISLPTSTKKSLQNEDWRSFNKTIFLFIFLRL